jgi:hypothetical protein
MSIRASMAAMEAWTGCEKSGYVGALPIPSDARLRSIAKKYFLIGYGMALTDHTMAATKRMKAAQDLDEGRNINKIKM